MMRQNNIYKLFVIIIVMFALSSCQKKTIISGEQTDNRSDERQTSEKNDLLDLPEDRIIVPLENPKTGAINGKAVIVAAVDQSEDTILTLIQDIPDEIDSLNSQAFRVQIFSSKLFGESRRTKKIAEEIFDRPVFMDYEVPYYKIRVGNFADRDKAEEYQMRVKSAGYTNAWVVVVVVHAKETSPLYDEFDLPLDIDSLIDEENENSNDE